ncbi:MAG: sortase, partial [Chloroflexota bacterium]
ALDGAGNTSAASTSTDNQVTFDSVAPTVTINQAVAQVDPTNASPINFTVVFSESVSGFVAADVTLSSGTAVVTGGPTTYNVAVSGMAQGVLSASLPAGAASDTTGNTSAASTSTDNQVTFDSVVPTVTITSSATSPTNTSPIPVTITFSEVVSGFVVGDITVGNGAAGNFNTTDNITFTSDITPTANGVVTVDAAASVAQDGSGNNNTAATQFSITYDNAVPTVAITSIVTSPTNTSPIPVTITFSEAVSGFVVGDITVGNGMAGNFNTTDNITYTADITPTANGVVTVDVAASVAQDGSGNNNTAATQFSIIYDNAVPTVAITSSATNPTNTSPIPVTITFSEVVSGFVVGDITVGNGAAGNFNTTDNITFTSDITPTANGVVTVDVVASVAQDSAGNNNTAATQFPITYDNTIPSVAITSSATGPTNTSPIPVTITFSEAVSGFVVGDITVGNGTAGNFNTTDNITYTAEITPTASGSVTVDVAASVAQDGSGNNNTAATQFSIMYDSVNPTVASTDLTASYTGTGPGSFVATFSKAVDDPAGNIGTNDVTNPANYLLVSKGANGIANTASCAGGVVTDDTQVTVTSVSYNTVTFKATVTLASALPVGSYRLFICGTTSIVDLAGNHLNGGSDYTFDFVVQAATQQGGGGNSNSSRGSSQQNTLLPATGFPQNKVTILPFQPADKAYTSTDLWLEIPNIGVKMSIVGVTSTKGGWDVTWLDKKAGWLNGSAFPSWSGNSVLTGHVWDALNQPGPFAKLKSLKYGDQVKIHVLGTVYTYEITESELISNTDAKTVFKHEDKSVITLITCENYKEDSNTYAYRRMVRAMLVSVAKEK